jgi:hypothetical protein
MNKRELCLNVLVTLFLRVNRFHCLPSARAAAQLWIDTLREAEQHINMKHQILANTIGYGAWDWHVSLQGVRIV